MARQRAGQLPGQARESRAGWLFVSPAVALIALFVVIPILMALWVSLSDWTGQGSPFAVGVHFIGLDNYAKLLTRGGLTESDFGISLRNNFWYVLIVVPLQTALALGLALIVNGRLLKGKSFFRTAYYFPSVTSSVAIVTVFIFIFSSGGVVNALLGKVGVNGPAWFGDARGIGHLLLGGLGIVDRSNPPSALLDHGLLGITWWDWVSGPSVALTSVVFLVIWTTAGTFMLIFLAALQDVPGDLEEAAAIDGAKRWATFRYVTIPHLRPTLLLVLTLGLIGTWQVFDQVYLLGQGAPAKTTLTPALLSYQSSFRDESWGVGAAISFILFVIILALASLQRWVLRDRDAAAEKKAARRARRRPSPGASVFAGRPS